MDKIFIQDKKHLGFSDSLLDTQIKSAEKKINAGVFSDEMLEVAKQYLAELKAEKARREGNVAPVSIAPEIPAPPDELPVE
jgi:hypothetical protein